MPSNVDGTLLEPRRNVPINLVADGTEFGNTFFVCVVGEREQPLLLEAFYIHLSEYSRLTNRRQDLGTKGQEQQVPCGREGIPAERKLRWTSTIRLAIFTCAMMKKTAVETRRINQLFRAFSDPIRLRILHLLGGGELCVGDLVTILRVPQPTASRHLAYLRKTGLVLVRKAGLWSYYSLAPGENLFHRKLLDCLDSCFGEVPELKADAARASKVKKAGGCCPTDAASQAKKATDVKDAEAGP